MNNNKNIWNWKKALTWLPLALVLCVAVTGCSRKSYFVALNDQEAIAVGSDVLLDGNKIGTVTEITRKGGSPVRAAQFVVTVPGVELRAGVEREQPGSIRLSSAACSANAPVLESGSTVPTRAPVTNFARTTVQSVRDFLYRFQALHSTALVVAGLIAAALVILILLRFLKKALWCLLIIGALIFALCAANAAPLKRQQVEAQIREVEALVAQAEQFAAEARRLAKAGLFSPAQIAGVRAEFACDRATYAEARNIENVDRLSAWTTSNETKTDFRHRYDSANQRRSKVEDAVAEVASASPNSDPRLIPLYLTQRDLVRSRIREGKTDENQLLKDLAALAKFPAPLIQQKLITVDNLSEVRLEESGIRLPNGQLFSLSATTNVASEQSLQDSKAAVEWVRLRQQVTEELNELRRERERSNSPVTIIVTNEFRTIVEKPIPTPALSPQTNTIVRFVTNRVFVDRPVTKIERIFVTNALPAATSGGQNGHSAPKLNQSLTQNQSMPLDSTNLALNAQTQPTNRRQSTTAASATPHSQVSPSRMAIKAFSASPPKTEYRPQTIAWILIAVVVFVFLVFFALRSRADEMFVIKLLVDGREREFDVEAGRDAVFLDAEVFCAEKNSPHPCPKVVIRRKGAILHPPKRGLSPEGDVLVNGVPASSPCVLQPGDVITWSQAKQADQSTKFIGFAEAVPSVDEVEMQYAPTNSTR